MASVLHTGMALHHIGNPAASLRLERLYGTPVLLSGLSALALLDSEFTPLQQHHKLTLQRLQRLHFSTPEHVGMFPATSLLHLRVFSLLGIISRLGPENILNQHGRNILLSATNKNPWKSFCKSKVIDMFE